MTSRQNMGTSDDEEKIDGPTVAEAMKSRQNMGTSDDEEKIDGPTVAEAMKSRQNMGTSDDEEKIDGPTVAEAMTSSIMTVGDNCCLQLNNILNRAKEMVHGGIIEEAERTKLSLMFLRCQDILEKMESAQQLSPDIQLQHQVKEIYWTAMNQFPENLALMSRPFFQCMTRTSWSMRDFLYKENMMGATQGELFHKCAVALANLEKSGLICLSGVDTFVAVPTKTCLSLRYLPIVQNMRLLDKREPCLESQQHKFTSQACLGILLGEIFGVGHLKPDDQIHLLAMKGQMIAAAILRMLFYTSNVSAKTVTDLSWVLSWDSTQWITFLSEISNYKTGHSLEAQELAVVLRRHEKLYYPDPPHSWHAKLSPTLVTLLLPPTYRDAGDQTDLLRIPFDGHDPNSQIKSLRNIKAHKDEKQKMLGEYVGEQKSDEDLLTMQTLITPHITQTTYLLAAECVDFRNTRPEYYKKPKQLILWPKVADLTGPIAPPSDSRDMHIRRSLKVTPKKKRQNSDIGFSNGPPEKKQRTGQIEESAVKHLGLTHEEKQESPAEKVNKKLFSTDLHAKGKKSNGIRRPPWR